MKNILCTRGRPKTFDEKEVLNSAMLHFWIHGYDNTSVDNLLTTMNIKKSSFYSTFKSKEEIFSRALKLYREQNYAYLQSLKDEIGPKRVMLTLTQRLIKELKETGSVRGCLLISSGKECYNRYAKLSEQIAMEFNFLQKFFVSCIDEAQKNGEIKNKDPAESIAAIYTNSLNGLMTTIQAGATQKLIDIIVKNLKEILK